ncbi:MAG: DUF1905 domain-containing protein [Bacteroidia bacterium]|nr:DUF1905 domain-containing protein [Bacteroidia bacterium]
MKKEKPLVNKKYKLEKYPGKGGWTYVVIPEIQPDSRAHFGWVKVKGNIDGFEISNYRLMPLGKGKLFLPVKAEIRKKIKKEEGDWVTITLYADNDPVFIPEELLLCLQDDPELHKAFLACTDGEKKAFIDWIGSAKKEETKVRRLAKTLDMLSKGIKFYGEQIKKE